MELNKKRRRINSREKGKRGERLFVSLCREHGYDDVRRTSQYCGQTGEAADVVGLPGIHCEVKFAENLNIRKAMAQATRDAEAGGNNDIPVVFHKKKLHPWLVTMDAEDFFTLYREWEAGGCNK